MTRNETTGERPTDYSTWHRTLSDKCKAQDVDWIEYRIEEDEIKIKAIIETGRWDITKFIGSQVDVSKKIADALNIPCYFVEYAIYENNYSKNVFKVKKLEDDDMRIMSDREYRNFIEGL